jgi:DNA-binding transcriptional LysR family regulator
VHETLSQIRDVDYHQRMNDIDLNLLTALDALLAEGSVTKAARRLGLSASAMSRTLARLRSATGDPLLVRAGRGLVPTPRAATLRDRAHELARETRALLSPQSDKVDLATLEKTFTIRTNEGFLARFSAPLVAAIQDVAPKVRIRFVHKPDKDTGLLRDGQLDLEIGVLGLSAPEMRVQLLFRDRFVGAVRIGHTLLEGPISPERYAACHHVIAARKDDYTGPVDDALKALGLGRAIVAVVPGFPDAMRIAQQSDLVALVAQSCFGGRSPDPLTQGLVSFDLPIDTPAIRISAIWHPRVNADPAHQWFRETVMAVCRADFDIRCPQ